MSNFSLEWNEIELKEGETYDEHNERITTQREQIKINKWTYGEMCVVLF